MLYFVLLFAHNLSIKKVFIAFDNFGLETNNFAIAEFTWVNVGPSKWNHINRKH